MVANIDDMGVLPRLLTLGRHADAPIQKEVQVSGSGPGGGKREAGVVFNLSEEGLALSRTVADETGRSREFGLDVKAKDDGLEIMRSFTGPDGRSAQMTATIERGPDGVEINRQVTLPNGSVLERSLEVSRSEDGVAVSQAFIRPDGASMNREDVLTRSADGLLREIEKSNSSGESGQASYSVEPDPDGEGWIVTRPSDGGEASEPAPEEQPEDPTDILV